MNDAFSELFELEASPVEGQSLPQKEPKDVRHSKFGFCACLGKNVVKRGASGKKVMLSCCKYLFEQIGANLAHTKAENLPNAQKVRFWQKALGVNGLTP